MNYKRFERMLFTFKSFNYFDGSVQLWSEYSLKSSLLAPLIKRKHFRRRYTIRLCCSRCFFFVLFLSILFFARLRGRCGKKERGTTKMINIWQKEETKTKAVTTFLHPEFA